MRVVRLLDRALGVCERIFLVLANAALVVMLVANAANIASRGIFDKGLNLVFPWTAFLFVWLTFLAFFVIYRRGRDITVGFLVLKLGRSGQAAAQLFANAVIVLVMIVILSQAERIFAAQVGLIEMVNLQRYMLSVPLFLSCALVLINTVLDTIKLIAGEGRAGSNPQATPSSM